MLAMCNLAKAVNDSDETTTVSGPWAEAAGLLGTTVSIASGRDNINAALVGKMDIGTTVAFRGTISVNDHTRPWKERLLDWMQDFDAVQTDWNGVFVHSGFAEAIDSMWPTVQSLITDDTPGVYFTGHSKGGAMATLAAIQFYRLTGRPSLVTTFGAARSVGAASANKIFGMPISIHRYENAGDIVPLTPPCTEIAELAAQELGHPIGVLDYESIGDLKFVNKERTVDTCSKFISQFRQGAALAELILHGNMDAIVDAHAIGLGGAYQQAVAPEVTGIANSQVASLLQGRSVPLFSLISKQFDT
jgi:hypothetical protein